MQHAAHALEQRLGLRLRHKEQMAEINNLHIDKRSHALMPGSRRRTDLDQRRDKGSILISTVRDVGEMSENVVRQCLQLGVFLDVHHVQHLLHEHCGEEGYERGAVVRRERGV